MCACPTSPSPHPPYPITEPHSALRLDSFRPSHSHFSPVAQPLFAHRPTTSHPAAGHFPPISPIHTLAHRPTTSRPSPGDFPPIARRLPAPRLDTASFCFGAINPLHVFINCDPTDQSLPVANRKKLINVAVSTYTLLVILAALLKYPWRCHIR